MFSPRTVKLLSERNLIAVTNIRESRFRHSMLKWQQIEALNSVDDMALLPISQ